MNKRMNEKNELIEWTMNENKWMNEWMNEWLAELNRRISWRFQFLQSYAILFIWQPVRTDFCWNIAGHFSIFCKALVVFFTDW